MIVTGHSSKGWFKKGQLGVGMKGNHSSIFTKYLPSFIGRFGNYGELGVWLTIGWFDDFAWDRP
jgi:hypothetical protein